MKKESFTVNRLLSGLILFLLFLPIAAFAQSSSIKGTVTDAKSGEALVGVSVVQKNTNNGTVTDLDGHFQLNVPSNTTLVISYLGYKTKEINASQSPMSILLEESGELLDEVIVVGYGVQKKSVVTASIAKVSAEDLGSTYMRSLSICKALTNLFLIGYNDQNMPSNSSSPDVLAKYIFRLFGLCLTDQFCEPAIYVLRS